VIKIPKKIGADWRGNTHKRAAYKSYMFRKSKVLPEA